jgi:outer membrane lipoprotein SlyB
MHVVGVVEAVCPVLLQLCHANNVGASEAVTFGGTKGRHLGRGAFIANLGRRD